MAAQSCTFSTDANAEEEPNFLRTESIRLMLTFDDEKIFRKIRFRRENIVTITDYTEKAIVISNPTDS